MTALLLIVALTLRLLVSPYAIEAQQAGKVYRIGLLAGSGHDPRAKRGYADSVVENDTKRLSPLG